VKSLIYRAAAQEPWLGRARSSVLDGVTVFMYHDIGPDGDDVDAWQVVRQRDFLAQVAYLKKYYQLISLDTAAELMDSDVQPRKPPAVLTFDDGLRGNHKYLLPLVNQYQLPVTIYIATEQIELQSTYWFDRVVNALDVRGTVTVNLAAWGLGEFEVRKARGAKRWADIQNILMAVKNVSESEAVHVARAIELQLGQSGHVRNGEPVMRPMSLPELQELARHPLVTIGSHTHGHELLPSIPLDAARSTIERSLEKIKAWTGIEARHFAFPSGRSNDDTRQLVSDLGFVTSVGTANGIWTRDDDVMDIPRISVGRYDSLDKFKINALSGLRDMVRSTIF
jgi:peptidoglycan/xylan/chitin deacetylase (PgdA/CDA1 family)